MSTELARLGWNSHFQAQLDELDEQELDVRRVAIEHQDRFTLVGGSEAIDAHLTGNLLQSANTGGARPAVGDWVALNQNGAIAHLFSRSTAFQRRSPRGAVQIIAANIDLVLVVTSCNAEFNLRRMERYLSAVAQSGAEPVVVLTKIDLCEDYQVFVDKLSSVVGTCPVFPVATPLGQGIEPLRALLGPGKTLALVGSSGVGKSTLANRLLGVSLFETAAIREQDGKGRHTTTRRELVLLPDERGVLIDTPGMRELQISADERGLDDAFEDILELAQRCRFANCRHQAEPGCEVRGAVEQARLNNYLAITKEQGQSRASKRQTERTVHRGKARSSAPSPKKRKRR